MQPSICWRKPCQFLQLQPRDAPPDQRSPAERPRGASFYRRYPVTTVRQALSRRFDGRRFGAGKIYPRTMSSSPFIRRSSNNRRAPRDIPEKCFVAPKQLSDLTVAEFSPFPFLAAVTRQKQMLRTWTTPSAGTEWMYFQSHLILFDPDTPCTIQKFDNVRCVPQ